ncbi:DUF5058 family protein [Brevibacterium litoralis]|uniref:DUF5058 family protein n=1 Tax=Brevibacterium litoralis TaxID=3138935 RepID=UPI0032EBAE4F
MIQALPEPPAATLVQAAAAQDIPGLANSPVPWIIALAVFVVILLQSTVFLMAVRRNAASADMTKAEVNTAMRSGAVSAIGPSLAVVLVAIALLPVFGTPPILVRVGLIGSAATETASAQIAAGTMGADLGSDTYTQSVFVVALCAMSLSGAGWMLFTLIATPLLSKGSDSLTKVNPALMALVPSAALLAAFGALTATELPKSWGHVVAVVVSALVMALCLWIAKVTDTHWLKEWALGFSVLTALVVTGIAHYNVPGIAA